jgi:CPA2 family monovalent cation:H+ antiporter-2
MHLAPLIRDLAVILGAAGLASLVFRRIKQPVVLGYLLAGILVGPHTPPYSFISDMPNVKVWAELGVIFLMFSLGLEFSFRKLMRVGAPASMAGLFEISLMLGLGYACGRALGWNFHDSLFLSSMVAISSTTIILKAFDEFGLKSHRFAELVLGMLIVEDLAAILLLVALGTIAGTEGFSAWLLMGSAGKLVLVIGAWFLIGYFAVPRFVKHVGRVGNDEVLTVTSIALCLGLVAVAAAFNYSVALGAFIMGSILAESIEVHRIETLVKPLRDIFAAIFFVSVGTMIEPSVVVHYWKAILLITGVVVSGKIVGAGLGSLATGQTLRTSTQVGFSLAQIGEFSFIIAGLGISLKVTSDFVYPIGVSVSLLTTFLTPQMIRVAPRVARWIESVMPERVVTFLHAYNAWAEERRSGRAGKAGSTQKPLRWILNALAVTLVFVGAAEGVRPLLRDIGQNESWQSAVCWAGAMLLCAPFLWGMLMSARSTLLTLVLVGLLSLEFFGARLIVTVLGFTMLLLFTVFHKRLSGNLEATYYWLEKQFLAPFHDKESKDKGATRPELAPWDAHLTALRVHPNADFAGKRLGELGLRNRLGINVVAIHRGERTIVPPHPEEHLAPFDELLVLGTDEQIGLVRAKIEKRSEGLVPGMPLGEYKLTKVRVGAGAEVVGRSIRNAGVREKFKSIVVGVERGSQRIINPDSNLEIEARDALWIVGEPGTLREIAVAFGRGAEG